MIPLISLHQPSGFQLLMGRVELGVSLRHLMKESEVAQSCPTLCNPVDYSPPGSSVHGILQTRILEWLAISWILQCNLGLITSLSLGLYFCIYIMRRLG